MITINHGAPGSYKSIGIPIVSKKALASLHKVHNTTGRSLEALRYHDPEFRKLERRIRRRTAKSAIHWEHSKIGQIDDYVFMFDHYCCQ